MLTLRMANLVMATIATNVIPDSYLCDLLLRRKGLAVFINPSARDRAHAH
jgi:hypothetical protein